MKEAPSATVAICTLRRPDALAIALSALAAQRDPGLAWDVLVVDDDPAGSAAPVVERVNEGFPTAIRVVAGPARGSAASRRSAALESGGTITVFMDDDVAPRDDWLGRLLTPIVAGQCDGVGGSVVLDPAVSRPRWLDEEGIGGLLARFDASGPARDLGPDEFVSTANAAFQTDLLREAEAGTEAFVRVGEGADMNDDVRISRDFRAAGGRLRYAPDAVVVHRLPPDRLHPGYVLRRAHAQGRADWRSDGATLSGRRFGGSRVALEWLVSELRRRAREGPWRPEVAFHAACDLARTAGALREAVALTRWRAARS